MTAWPRDVGRSITPPQLAGLDQGRLHRHGVGGPQRFGGCDMVTMILFYEGQRIVFEGSMAEVLDSLRAWCPSGLAVEVFGRGREQ